MNDCGKIDFMISQSHLSQICKWNSSHLIQLCLGIETHGSGMNIRISNLQNYHQFLDIKNTNVTSSLEAQKVLEKLSSTLTHIAKKEGRDFECKGTTLSAAGPVWNNSVVLSNWPGPSSDRTIKMKDLPSKLFPLNRSLFMNNIEACGYGVIMLKNPEKIFKQIWKDKSPKPSPFTRAAFIQMNTGLGVSIIVNNPLTPKPVVVATELGHLQIPSILPEEKKLIQHLSNCSYKGIHALEFEDIVSGKGLSNIYDYYSHVRTSPSEIILKAKKGDQNALKAMSITYQNFMKAIKVIGVCTSVDTIFIGRNLKKGDSWYMEKIDHLLKKEFYSFNRPEWMNTIQVYMQTKECNLSLLGTSFMAHSIASA